MKILNSIPLLFKEKTLETFEPQGEADRRFIEKIKDIKNCDKNIIILGDCGLGKTHILYSVLKNLSGPQIDDSHWYESDCAIKFKARELIETVHKTWNKDLSTSEYENCINRYNSAINAEWLFIDDLGKQYFTESAKVEMHSILDERYEGQKKHFITSNLRKEGIVSLIGEAAADRLFFNSIIHVMEGTSQRTRELPISF